MDTHSGTPPWSKQDLLFLMDSLQTLAPTTTQISDRLSCSIGSIATTGIGHMVA
jgi:hypothetical protein